MKLYLLDEEKINTFSLPTKIEESFLFSYIPSLTNIEIFLNIYSNEEKWYFKNDSNIKIENSNNDIILENYKNYNIKIRGSNYNYILFTYPINENYNEYLINDTLQTINIGRKPSNDIIYQELDNDIECSIIKENGIYYIIPQSQNTKTYVNKQKIINKTILNIGDIIFIKNLKIIWMKKFIRIYNTLSPINISNNINIKNEKLIVDNEKYLNYEQTENDIPLYKNENYFFHKPRLITRNTESTVTIDPPPGKFGKEELPFILSIGASGTMIIYSFINIFNTLSNIDPNKGITIKVILPIIQSIVMLITSAFLPMITKRYQKKLNEKKENERQKKYSEYLIEKTNEINIIIREQQQNLYNNNLSSFQCYELVIGDRTRLWERKITDDDFLTIRVGIGNLPANLIVNSPEEKFELNRDNLIQKTIEIKNNSKTLKKVPITLSLSQNLITSIICNTNFKKDYIYGIILQLITLHSPKDLKTILLTSKDKEYQWNAIKLMPHIFNEEKSLRYFATNEEEAKEIFKELEIIFNERTEKIKNSQNKEEIETNTYSQFDPYYLIITDNIETYKNLSIFEKTIDLKKNIGFSFLIIDKSIKHLNNECNKYICIEDKTSNIFEKEYNNESQINFTAEYCSGLDMYRIARELSNIPIQVEEGASTLPTSLSFLEMYNVGNIEQLAILNRWNNSNPIISLSCPIGVHPNGDLFKLDLHEKAHGPHGLIAGSTGSGKSEFIITYILSMAINYHPDEVQFVLIDYKGGGLAGAFENREKGIKIPHLAGTITNLDVSEMNRTLVSINSELKRRQRKFNEVRDILGESTIDIYKYQKYYREGVIKEPIPHLFIISDEFAELKSQQPEFMDELISTARIGRSLGVHLILATQKPSGVVNDQIWSNSKFKICLKVQTTSDSNEMLKKPDAASIKETGRFYLQVGYDELFELGQSAWSGAQYIPSEKVLKKYDDSITFIDNIGNNIKSINNLNKQNKDKASQGEQITNIVKYLCDIGIKNNIQTPKLWLDSIPEEIYLNNIISKYNYKATPFILEPVIGEYDSPAEQKQGLLKVNISQKGNLLIYGMPNSGKENLLSTIIYSLTTSHTTNEMYIYIIDYASEILKRFNKFPQVGDIILSDENEKLGNFVSMLFAEIEKRKDLLQDYSGSIETYNNENTQKLPNILCIISGYDNFQEIQPNISERLITLYKDGPKYGIYFIISTSLTNIRLKIKQLFNNVLTLRLNDSSDYRYLVGAPRNLIPANYFGRGIIQEEENSYEFQTAYITKPDSINAILKETSNKLNEYIKEKAPKIPILPEYFTPDYITKNDYTLENVPIGIVKNNLQISYYDFKTNNSNLILANNLKKHINFIYGLTEILNRIPTIKIRIIDCLNIYKSEQNIDVFNEDFNTLIKQIKIETNNDGTRKKHNLFIILGLSEFKNKIDDENQNIFDSIFNEIKKYKGNTFIILDNYTSFRSLETRIWFNETFNKYSGIWLGDNISTQLFFRSPDLSLNDKKISFNQMAYILTEDSYDIIKYIVDKEYNIDNEK